MNRTVRVSMSGREAADEVDDLARRRCVERVDGEVASFGVLLPVRAESDQSAAAVRVNVAAQRRDLERNPVHDQRDRAVVDAGRHGLDPGSLRTGDHLGGNEGRGDVDVARRQLHQAVAHRATGNPRLPAIGVEKREHALQRRVLEPVLIRYRRHAYSLS
jgi:hypothetical protein